jgi:tetratricopeptide (TPR) repeat protein
MPPRESALPEQNDNRTESRWPAFRVASLLAIAAVVVAAYGNSLEAPFIFDDRPNISENPHLRLTQLDWRQLWGAAFESRARHRPVANLSFALNYLAGQDRVWGYRVVNVCIHLMNGVLVYFLALTTFRRAPAWRGVELRSSTAHWMSLAAALLFVSHPIQTQAVTYLVQRMTSLSTLFYLAALLLYIGGRTADDARRRRSFWIAGLSCWLLALGTKQNTATLPILVFLYEWYFFRDMSRVWLRRSVRYALPMIVLVGVAVLTYLGDSPWEAMLRGYDHRDFTMGERVLTQFRVLMLYLGLVIWPLPSRFSITHDISASNSLFDPATTFLSLLVLLGLLLAAVLTARRYRIVSFCILWVFLHLAIESSVIPLELAYEHRMYLPILGISMLASWGLFTALRDVRWAIVATAGLVLLLAVATHHRNRVWQDARTVWNDVLEKYPQDARAYNNLGAVHEEAGEHSSALEAFDTAIRLSPNYQKAYLNRGILYAAQGESFRAIEDFSYAIAIQPGDLKWWPDYGEAHQNRGAIYTQIGRFDLAIEDLTQAIELGRENSPNYSHRSVAYAGIGRYALAFRDGLRAIDLDLGSASAHNNLAWILATAPDPAIRDGAEAVRYATRACELTEWKDPGHLDTLAAAYAEAGDFERAVRVTQHAIELERRREPPALLAVLRAHLADFEAGQPLRDPE